MTYIKINDRIYPAVIEGRLVDREWDNRDSKAITLDMDYTTAVEVFVDGVIWSIIDQYEVSIYDETGNPTGTEIQEMEYDNSDYCIAGDITDHRDGAITVKMGKFTTEEMLLMEVLA